MLRDLGPAVQWQHSYVTADNIYCVYIVPNDSAVREHARRGGFQADRVARITTVIDPATAD